MTAQINKYNELIDPTLIKKCDSNIAMLLLLLLFFLIFNF